MLEASGVPVILSAGGWDQNARRLRQEAGTAVSYGLSRKGALAALTETPAEVFGLLDEVGTIRVGGPATFGLYSARSFRIGHNLGGTLDFRSASIARGSPKSARKAVS